MTLPASDQALVDGLRAGDHAAFERVYGDHSAAIYNLCARILGDREEARDVTQDVFIKAFSSPPAAAGPVTLRPWLYRVATNACFNHLRVRKHLGGDPSLIDGARAPVDEYERARTVSLVEQSLGELNDRYRTVLVLKDLHGLPAAEIAEVMAVSRPAADVLVHRARAAFKTTFGKLSGQTGAAPASLGLVLAPLSVPAALHVMPPLPIPLGSAPYAPPLPDLTSSVGPAGAGLLTKIGAALSTKIGITAAAATLAAGGGAAVYKAESHDEHRVSAAASRHDADAWSESHANSTAGSHQEGHGRPLHGRVGHRNDHTGGTGHEDGHTSDGSATTSDHSAGGESGSGTSPTAHDGAEGTWSPAHDGDGDTSGTHESDSGP